MVLKRCFVPLCNNNSYITPNKIFIVVPYNKILQESWFRAVNKPFAFCKQKLFCCEDHFNLPEAVENWNYYKTFGRKLILKKGILPKPDLKQTVDANKSQFSPSSLKRKLENNDQSTSLEPPMKTISLADSSLIRTPNVRRKGRCSRTTQTKEPPRHNRDVAVNTKRIKSLKSSMCESCLRNERKCDEHQSFMKYSSFSEPSSNDDRSASTSSTISKIRERMNMLQQEKFKIETNCRLYLGLPEDVFVLINTLKNKMDYTNILITLKKIRTDDSFHRLSIDFCKNKSTISRIFQKTVPILAAYMKQLIIWPHKMQIRKLMPSQFQAYYNNVESIIDCFEIEIQKPNDSMAQALTWSSNKSCNTVKFLISSTPNGLVNFVSPALGGCASDLEVVKKSGYLDVIPYNTVIMADRRFKHIVPLLNQKGATLIEPPSVSSSEILTKDEVHQTKIIAALRIHIERLIKRLHEFRMLEPHACIPISLIGLLEYCVIIACGIVNLQKRIIQ